MNSHQSCNKVSGLMNIVLVWNSGNTT